MRQSWLATGGSALLLLFGVAAAAADEFTPPPKAERDVVANITKGGGRVTIDGEYRVTGVILGSDNTNDDLKSLAACERISTISISSPKVTDEGLAHLHALKKLTSIGVNSTGTTTAGVTALREALPDCRVSSFGRTAPPGGDRGPAVGGPPGGFGGFGGGFSSRGSPFGSTSRTTTLLRNPEVQDDLKLTAEQKAQISESSGTTALSAAMKLLDEKVLAVLTPEQKARMKQIDLQQAPANMLRPDIVTQLKLSTEQVASVTKVHDEYDAARQTALRDLFAQRTNETTEVLSAKLREKLVELNKQRDEKVTAALNDEQQKAWKEMIGPPGPVINTPSFPASERFGGFGARTAADAAKALFERYDTNKDNLISDDEFPETNRTRSAMKAAGITLVYPATRETFESNYAKYYEQSRRR